MTVSTYEHVNHSISSRRSSRNHTDIVNVRRQALPENFHYRDTGCELAPSCLQCPLALCKYDDPNWGKRASKVGRDMEIVRLRSNGMRVAQIATEINASERTVYRVIQRDYYPRLSATRKSAERPRRRKVAASPMKTETLSSGWHQFQLEHQC